MLEKLDLLIISLVEGSYEVEIRGKYLSCWKGNFDLNLLCEIRYWIVIGLYFAGYS